MKNLIVLLFVALSQLSQAQIVNIPDINFKNALIGLGVDTNGDGQIQESEALDIIGLNLKSKNISSLQGIKSFVNLKHLNCQGNQLTSLDLEGLTNMQNLFCDNNQLNSLNLHKLLFLQDLFCEFNQLQSLELQGLTNLTRIYCQNNLLTNLNVQGLTNLQVLVCSSNQLINLDVQGFTNLQLLYCQGNQLTNLDVKGLTNLSYLDCSSNQLTNLDVQGLTNLSYLDCSSNQLTNLDVQGLTNLQTLGCDDNQLVNLDVQGLPNLQSFSCYSNQLVSLNIKNGNIFSSVYFYGNPNLKYICCDDFKIKDISAQATQSGLTNCSVNSYCSFTPGGKFYTIKGENKLDIDNNGCDAGDILYPNLKFSITNGIDFGSIIVNTTGEYSIPVQAGTHIMTPTLENPSYFQVSPSSIQVSFPNVGDSLIQNFCITPNDIYHDVQITILPITPARPGFDANYKIVYNNQGTQIGNGTINFLFDDSVLVLVSTDLTPDIQSTGLLSWNYADLKPFESRSINLVLDVNSPMETPPVNIGDLLSFEANISISDPDETPLNNVFNFRQTVVGSYDPKDKTCLEGNTITPDMVGEYVHYLIRFENTGTFAAENVVVKDVIDASVFDIQTLELIDASHELFTRIKGNVVEFIFEGIQLPFDDVTNDGYVVFKIKTKPTLILGDSLKNKAEIYFDYNFPIITNETQTLVKNAVGTTDTKELSVDFFPNPAKDQVRFLINEQIEKAHIYDLNGRILRSTTVINNQLNIEALQIGTYMVRLFAGQKTYIAKVVKM